MNKWLKVAVFGALLIGAGYFFGTICGQLGQTYKLILAPSGEILTPLFWFLLAWGAVMVTAGLVAALLRPVWVGLIAFALSALAMLLGWQVTMGSGILAFLYFLAAAVYARGVAGRLEERIKFSLRPLSEGQGTLLMALALVASGSLYLSYAAHIEREGFSIPGLFSEMVVGQMEKRIEAGVPAEARQEAVARLRGELSRAVDQSFAEAVKPYEGLIPIGLAAGSFVTLLTITRLLAWVPTLLLRIAFPLLRRLGVIQVVTETREVQRMTLG